MINHSLIRPKTGTFAAAAVAIKLWDANPRRKSGSVYNNDVTTVYVLMERTQVATDGKPIVPTGERVWKHFDCQCELWFIGTGSATYDLRVEEVLQDE